MIIILKCYAIWKVKDGVVLNKDILTFFSPGGFSFTNKDNTIISFDFMDSESSFSKDDKYIYTNMSNIDEDIVLDNKSINSISIDMFTEGYIDLVNNEFFCSIDVLDNNKIIIEPDPNDYLEPVYLSVSNDDYTKEIVLFNKLTTEEFNNI